MACINNEVYNVHTSIHPQKRVLRFIELLLRETNFFIFQHGTLNKHEIMFNVDMAMRGEMDGG